MGFDRLDRSTPHCDCSCKSVGTALARAGWMGRRGSPLADGERFGNAAREVGDAVGSGIMQTMR